MQYAETIFGDNDQDVTKISWVSQNEQKFNTHTGLHVKSSSGPDQLLAPGSPRICRSKLFKKNAGKLFPFHKRNIGIYKCFHNNASPLAEAFDVKPQGHARSKLTKKKSKHENLP